MKKQEEERNQSGGGGAGGPSYSTAEQPKRTTTMAQKAVTVRDIIVFVCLVFLKQRTKIAQLV